MRIAIYVLIALCLVLLIVGYAVLVMASEADERAERMYIEWKESEVADDE